MKDFNYGELVFWIEGKNVIKKGLFIEFVDDDIVMINNKFTRRNKTIHDDVVFNSEKEVQEKIIKMLEEDIHLLNKKIHYIAAEIENRKSLVS